MSGSTINTGAGLVVGQFGKLISGAGNNFHAERNISQIAFRRVCVTETLQIPRYALRRAQDKLGMTTFNPRRYRACPTGMARDILPPRTYSENRCVDAGIVE